MALSIFENALGRDRTVSAPKHSSGRRRFDYSKGAYVTAGAASREKFAETAGRTLSAVQMVCDALIPPSAGRYTVAFGGRTAMTERGKRRITVTPQPLYMKGLRLADVADTLTGFVVHEIGHVEISGESDRLLAEWLEQEPGYLPWRASIYALSNVLDDHALEVWAKRRFPGVAQTFRVTTKFVAQEQDMFAKPPRKFSPDDSFTERFNLMVCAVRYRWFVRWINDPATKRERQWWIDWAERYGNPSDAVLRLEGIKVGIARLAINPKNRPPEVEPEPQQGDGEPDEDEDEGEEPETFDTGDDDDDDEDDDESDEDEDGDPDDDDDDEDDDDDDADGDEGDDDDGDGDDDDEGDLGGGNDDGDDDVDPTREPEPGPLGFNEDGTNSESEPDDEADESDEDGEDEDEDWDEDEDGDEGDPGGVNTGKSGDDIPEGTEDRSEERPDGGELDATEDLGQVGEGGSNAPIFESFDPERLDRDRIQTVDDFNEERERYDGNRDEMLQKQVEVEMRAERVTDPHGYGEMKVVINL